MLITRETLGQTFQETSDVQNYFRLTSYSKNFIDFGIMKVYGIEVRCGNVIERIEDISINKEVVISLLEKLETEKCSPLHFKDVVDDFVIDQII